MSNTDKPYNILFLCTGNSARSIMAEYLMNRLGKGKFNAFSAGSHPSGKVNPFAIKTLKEYYKIDCDDARSKSWDEFKGKDFDFVITVCDNAKESCPVWPGQPIVAHWSSQDPAACEGSDEAKAKAFYLVSREIYRRLEIFVNLPFHSLDKLKLADMTKNIGQIKNSPVNNAVGWFEIGVNNLSRAKIFYQSVLGITLTDEKFDNLDMAWFPMIENSYGASGALVQGGDYTPSKTGPLIYFSVIDIDKSIELANKAGGKMLMPKTSIGQYGSIGMIEDSEGNRIGLHTKDS